MEIKLFALLTQEHHGCHVVVHKEILELLLKNLKFKNLLCQATFDFDCLGLLVQYCKYLISIYNLRDDFVYLGRKENSNE